jgi:response regulator RpfG family c-di-GMP phosphodiesterase
MDEGETEGGGYQYTLIVGDDGVDRAWIEGTLMRGGLEVAASTHQDLANMPDIVPPHLAVLDDASNRQERMANFRSLRLHPALAGVPVVMLAYDADIESFSEAISKGAAAYLVKPVNAEELVAVAHKLSGWLSSSDRTEKRRRLRRPLVMKVEVDLRARKLRVPGQIIDVSGGGCRVELGEKIEKGDLVRVILHGADDSTHMALGAEVRWTRQASDGTWVAGLRFTGTTALLASKVLGFVHTGMT